MEERQNGKGKKWEEKKDLGILCMCEGRWTWRNQRIEEENDDVMM